MVTLCSRCLQYAVCCLLPAVCSLSSSHVDFHHELLSTVCHLHFSHWTAVRFRFWGSFALHFVQLLLIYCASFAPVLVWVRDAARASVASLLTEAQTLTPASAACRMRHMRVRALCSICLALISGVGRMWTVGWGSGSGCSCSCDSGMGDAILSVEPFSPAGA